MPVIAAFGGILLLDEQFTGRLLLASIAVLGGIALVYFLTMSTLALGIGLVVGNIIHPGEGLHITPDVAEKAASAATAEKMTTADFLLHMIPTTLFSALTTEVVLQTLLVALLVGFALQAMGKSGEPILKGIGHLQKLVFRVKAQGDPEVLKRYGARVKTGLPGVATVRLDPTAEWPAHLQVRLAP